MQAGVGPPETSKRRREHAKYSRRRLRLTATLCQRSRERKPGDAIDPPPFRCRLVRSMRIRDVLRIPRTSYQCYAATKYHHRWRLHVTLVSCRLLVIVLWTRIIRITVLVHACEISADRVSLVNPWSELVRISWFARHGSFSRNVFNEDCKISLWNLVK